MSKTIPIPSWWQYIFGVTKTTQEHQIKMKELENQAKIVEDSIEERKVDLH